MKPAAFPAEKFQQWHGEGTADRVPETERHESPNLKLDAAAGLEPATSLPIRWTCRSSVRRKQGLYPTELHRETHSSFIRCLHPATHAGKRNRFPARAAEAKNRPPHRDLEKRDSILKIQHHFLELAERFEAPIVDNISFDQSVLLIIRHVTDTLSQRHGFDAKEIL